MTTNKPSRPSKTISPEFVLASIYGRTTTELKMSEKRRDEVIAAAIFTSFWNQEFSTHFQLPADYRSSHLDEDAEGIDIIVTDPRRGDRRKQLQIKGIYLARSIERRRRHKTRGYARILGRRSQRFIRRDSEELTKIMQDELRKIIHDYGGLILIINVIADLATQTSLEIAIKNSQPIVAAIKAKEIWFLRHIPGRDIFGKSGSLNCHAYKLIRVIPYRHTYGFSFAL